MSSADALAATETHAVADPQSRLDTGPHFQVGEVVAGAYVVRRVLGTGGMGQVYAADEIDLRRPVAIKTNHAVYVERLRLEAQALAQVQHRNVVGIHRFGMHRDVPFMVLERLCGRSLMEHISARQLRGKPTELDETLELLCGIATGLCALHDLGIAHLDLKPSNVMVCAEQRVVLIDLGVMVPEVAAARRRPCGTPLYMAPEVIEGELRPGRAHLADLYAFGALAYELVTGAPMFYDSDPVHVLACQLVDEPADVRELRPDAPAKLADLVRSCLMKDPSDRPSDAHAIVWELRSIQRRARQDSGPLSLVASR